MITDINIEDRLAQRTFTEHLEKVLGRESNYAYNTETFETPLPSPPMLEGQGM